MTRADLVAVVPTIPGREWLLERALAGFERVGVATYAVEDSPSCGEGWATGLALTSAPLVLLAADDVEPYDDWPELELALERAARGYVLVPQCYHPDGRLEGGDAGFFLASRPMLSLLGPIAPFQHGCHTFLRDQAVRLGVGPFVSHWLPLVHKIRARERPEELGLFASWSSQKVEQQAWPSEGDEKFDIFRGGMFEALGVPVYPMPTGRNERQHA